MASLGASSSINGGDVNADLTRLLQQLQKSVLDDRTKMATKGNKAADAAAASDDDDDHSDIDMEEQDGPEDEVVFEESELRDMMKEAANVHVSRWTTGLGGGLGATLGASGGGKGMLALPMAAATATLGASAVKQQQQTPRRQLSKAQSATKDMLGAPTLMKQLEGVFTELDAVSSAEPPVTPSSPQQVLYWPAADVEFVWAYHLYI